MIIGHVEFPPNFSEAESLKEALETHFPLFRFKIRKEDACFTVYLRDTSIADTLISNALLLANFSHFIAGYCARKI